MGQKTEVLTLVGLPGSGKSTVGRHLARRWGVSLVDSDHVIEQRLGTSIRDFFASHGEEAFRDLEQQVLDELTAQGQGRCILATGGGAVLRTANRRHLHERSTVFYLKASPEELLHRLRNDKVRPLLQVANPGQRLRELFAQRDPLYAQTAHYTIDSARLSASQLVHRVGMQAEMAGLLMSQQMPLGGD